MNNIKGFTLIELMITIAIMGIVIGIGFPSFQSMIVNSRLTTQSNNLVGALNIARSESVKRGKFVVVKKVTTSWQGGWEVFVDDDKDQTKDSGEEIIKSYEALVTGYSINVTTGYTNHIYYRPDGRSNTNGSFYVCSPAQEEKFKRIVIASSGRIRSENQDTVTNSATYANDC